MENKTFKWKNLAILILGFSLPSVFIVTKDYDNSKIDLLNEEIKKTKTERDCYLETAKQYSFKYKKALGEYINCETKNVENLIKEMDASRTKLAPYIKDNIIIE